MKPMLWDDGAAWEMDAAGDVIATVKETVLCSGDIIESDLLSDSIAQCLVGDTVLIVDGCDRATSSSAQRAGRRGRLPIPRPKR